MRKRLIFIFTFLLASGLLLCLFLHLFLSGLNDMMPKDEIFKIVRKNEQLLIDDIAKENFKSSRKISGIKEISVNENCIDFYCGGAGMGGETRYCGFRYYVNDDIIKGVLEKFDRYVMQDGEEFGSEDRGYISRYDGDNIIYLEQITGNFYYYYEEY